MLNHIENFIVPHLENLLIQLHLEKKNLTLAKHLCFQPKDNIDYFVAGKAIFATSFVLEYKLKYHSEDLDSFKEIVKDLLHFCINLPLESWGILNFLWGLHTLKKIGMYEEFVDKNLQQQFKDKLHYKHFIDEEGNLIDKPTNYLGVAFAIARYRAILSIDDNMQASLFQQLLINHVASYSGENPFMDETKGDGRFDRYTFLIPAEIASHFIDTGLPVPPIILRMLKISSDVFMFIKNRDGHGFMYGRSIGAYGDTSAGEVLSMASRLNLLSTVDKEEAYAYNLVGLKKYCSFWIDSHTQSINLWLNGRKTDDYRHIGRILGENFSTAMQWVNIARNYDIAFYGITPKISENQIKRRARFQIIRFKESPEARFLFNYHDGSKAWMLPLIDGGNRYRDEGPYFPIWQSTLIIEPSPNSKDPNFFPHLVTHNETFIPTIPYKNVHYHEHDNQVKISFECHGFQKIGLPHSLSKPGHYLKVQYLINDTRLKATFIWQGVPKNSTTRLYLPFFQIFQNAGVNKFVSESRFSVSCFGLDIVTSQKINDLSDANLQTNHGNYHFQIKSEKQGNTGEFGYIFSW